VRYHTRGYGLAHPGVASVPITPTSVFHVASVSKQFTATAIALLAREGQLTLDDDVRRYVPELPTYSAPITLRHLILHTSGLRDQWDLLYLAGWREADLKTNADVLALARRQRR
jgi:CubicO group peptidase (beta-lactamase class C family)